LITEKPSPEADSYAHVTTNCPNVIIEPNSQFICWRASDLAHILPVGKVPPAILEEVVFKRGGAPRGEVILAPAIGEDTAVVDIGQEYLIASTDPITGATGKAGWLAVKVALNDIGASGGEPVCVLVTLLLPEGASKESLREIMDDIHAACSEENVAVAGGHTEVTPGLDRPIMSVTALGRTRGRRVLRSSGCQAGDDIVVTKWAGMEGTAILARDFRSQVSDFLTEEEICEAEALLSKISVVKEGAVAAENGAHGSHDATEGGVLGAIYELCEASGLGARVDADRIPVLPVTSKIAARTGIDPLKLVSSGCLVVSHPDGAKLCEVYRRSGINAEVVGKMTSGGREAYRGGRTFTLEAPKTDELWKAREVLERFSAR
jgi:hydrogenase maturation factor